MYKAALILLWPLIILLVNAQAQATEQPNILFILADDHAYDATGLMSHGYVQTPNIDKLAANGVYFERAYNMGSWNGAVCLASRTMLSTGKTLWHAKALSETKQISNHISWAQRLKKAGYSTFFTGKWHAHGYQPKVLFDQWGTIRYGGMPKTKGDHHRPVAGKQDTWSASDPALNGYWKGGQHWSEVTADVAINYIKQHKNSANNTPFFAYVAFNAPHDPRQSPQEYLDKYPLDSVPLPNSYMPSYPYTKDIGIWNIRAETLAPRPRTEFAVKTHRKEYYALVSHLDAQVGRILAELDKQGLRDNTIIIYTADHGLSLGNHSFFAKQSMYEHSLASPLILSGPDIPKGIKTKQRVYIQDVMPTTLELGGLKKNQYADVEFESLLPRIQYHHFISEQAIYAGYKNFSRTIIKQDWKLIYYPKINKIRLYNLNLDPYELKDLAHLKSSKTMIKKLLTQLQSQQQKLDDELNIDSLLNQQFF